MKKRQTWDDAHQEWWRSVEMLRHAEEEAGIDSELKSVLPYMLPLGIPGNDLDRETYRRIVFGAQDQERRLRVIRATRDYISCEIAKIHAAFFENADIIKGNGDKTRQGALWTATFLTASLAVVAVTLGFSIFGATGASIGATVASAIGVIWGVDMIQRANRCAIADVECAYAANCNQGTIPIVDSLFSDEEARSGMPVKEGD